MLYPRHRIWMIGWEYPPFNSGGLGVACEGLTKSLSGMNTNIYFVLPFHMSTRPGHMQLISCVDPTWTTDSYSPPFHAYASASPATNDQQLLSARQLAALPQSELEHKVSQYADLVAKAGRDQQRHYDVIHAHDWMSFPAAIKLKQQTGKPLITHIHSTEVDRIPGGHGSPYITQIEKSGMDEADTVITVSHYTKAMLVRYYGIPANKIFVVHNGIDEPVIPPQIGIRQFAPHRPVVAFMGRLTGQKGPQYFLQLAKAIQARQPEVLFVVAGDGDMYRHLLVSTAQHQLSSTVVFSSFVRGKQQAQLLDRADVFVMPSISEPFGLVALEAAQRHTPVIISKQSGVSEVMPNAIAIDFWDINKMADATCALLANPVLSQKVIDSQLQDVRQVTWGDAAGKVKNIYQAQQ